jgi:transcriptional regulator with XRE-family HTH domain
MSEVMSYTPSPELPETLKRYWLRNKKRSSIKRIAEASEMMGMKAQYFGQLCNGQRLVSIESMLKIAAFFEQSPRYFEPDFPTWAMHRRSANEKITYPMLYTPSTETQPRIKSVWDAQDMGLVEAGKILGLSKASLSLYLRGKQSLNAEFILKFSTLTDKHPRDFDPAFPAFFLV